MKAAAPQAGPAPGASRLRLGHALALLAVLLLVFFRKIILAEAFFWEDFIYYYYPTRNFAATALASGQFPFWNPYTFSGMPFMADIQNAVLYLPHVLFALVAGTRLSPVLVELMVLAHFLFAGASMVALARYLKLDLVPALAAGLFFMLSGFMVAHAIHQTVIASVSWLPLITLLTLRAFQEPGWTAVPLAGIALAMAVFAGFPQVFYYIFLYEGCLILLLSVRSARRAGGIGAALPDAGRGAAIIGIALGLAAIQLLPTMELAPQSARAAITLEKSLEGSLSWGQLLTLLVPKFFGVSGAEGYQYWGPGPYWHYWETCIYLGIPALMLMVLGAASLKGRPVFQFLAAVALVSLLIGLGDSFVLHRLLFDVLPGYDKFRNPARCTLLFAFGGALLAGLGAQALLEPARRAGEPLRGEPRKGAPEARSGKGPAGGSPRWAGAHTERRVWLALGAVLVPLLLVKAGLFSGSFDFLRNAQTAAMVSRETTQALVIALAAAGLLVLAVRRVLPPPTALLLLIGLWFIDIHLFGFAQNNGKENPAEYFQRSSERAAPLLAEGQHELFRINARDRGAMLFDRNQGMMDPLFLMEGYTPLALTNVWPAVSDPEKSFDLMNTRYRIRVDEQRQTMGLERRTTYLPRVFFAAAGRVCPTRPDLERYMQAPAFDHRRQIALEEPLPFALPETSSVAAEAPARVTAYGLNRIQAVVEAPVPGVLVFSELSYPGWTATVDGAGEKVYRTDGCLRGVPVPAGAHTVELRFLPASFVRGGWISAATLLLALGGILAARRGFFGKRDERKEVPV